MNYILCCLSVLIFNFLLILILILSTFFILKINLQVSLLYRVVIYGGKSQGLYVKELTWYKNDINTYYLRPQGRNSPNLSVAKRKSLSLHEIIAIIIETKSLLVQPYVVGKCTPQVFGSGCMCPVSMKKVQKFLQEEMSNMNIHPTDTMSERKINLINIFNQCRHYKNRLHYLFNVPENQYIKFSNEPFTHNLPPVYNTNNI